MKKQDNIVGKVKRKLIAILVLCLAAGWLCTLYYVTVDRELRAQTALVRSAETFLEDKLYIRAVEKYVEALRNYQTDQNDEIEKQLLKTYKDGEMWNEYYELIRDRIGDEKAEADEYLEIAEFYLDSGNVNSAIQYLETGKKIFPENDELVNLDESVRYEVSGVSAAFLDAGIPSPDYYIPVFNGEKWGYILENGRTAIDFLYDEATRFSGNYAVVRLNGTYTLIDKNGYWNAIDKNGLDKVESICGTRIVAVKDGKYGIYTNTFNKISDEDYENVCLNADGQCFVQKAGKWALLDSELKPVTDYIFTDVAKNSQGEVFYKDYAAVADEGGYYLINKKGEERFSARFSDAGGIESGLVAVADPTGKWGYCDENGELIVDYQYEDARSFSGRLGAVKFAGKWGYINQYNTMVIENEYEAASPFLGELGLAVDSQGNYRLLKLKYYDIYMNQ